MGAFNTEYNSWKRIVMEFINSRDTFYRCELVEVAVKASGRPDLAQSLISSLLAKLKKNNLIQTCSSGTAQKKYLRVDMIDIETFLEEIGKGKHYKRKYIV